MQQPLLTKQFLADLGIELSEQSYELLAEHFETTLQDRVLDEIVAELTPEQAAELAQMRDAGDERIYAWLQETIPELSDIISDEVDILLGEVAEDSEAIANS